MRIIPDLSVQVLALENGEVDFLWELPGPHLQRASRAMHDSGPRRPGTTRAARTAS